MFVYGATGSVTYTYSGGNQFCTYSGSDNFPITFEEGSMAVIRRQSGWEYQAAVQVRGDESLNMHEQCEGETRVIEVTIPPVLRGPGPKIVRVGTGSLTGTYRDGDYSIGWSFTGLPRRNDLRANPGGPYSVKRAGRVRLDGSGSRPRREITEYKWKFKTIPGDCEGIPSQESRKDGRVVRVVALCGIRATLTVVDRDGDRDSKSTVVNVKPRGPSGWRTPFAHREKTGDPQTPRNPPSATSVGSGNYAFSLFGGLNISDCGGSDDEILCPLAGRGRSWLGNGYELARVNDPRGPFDGFFYVGSSQLRVKRAGLINPTILPGSTFYQHNLGAGRDVAGFVNAIRQHEGMGNGTPRSGHSLAMKEVLQTANGDARRVIEKLFAPAREGTKNRVDRALEAIERRLDRESDDPLPDIWTGAIDFYDSYQQQWITGQGFRIPGGMRG